MASTECLDMRTTRWFIYDFYLLEILVYASKTGLHLRLGVYIVCTVQVANCPEAKFFDVIGTKVYAQKPQQNSMFINLTSWQYTLQQTPVDRKRKPFNKVLFYFSTFRQKKKTIFAPCGLCTLYLIVSKTCISSCFLQHIMIRVKQYSVGVPVKYYFSKAVHFRRQLAKLRREARTQNGFFQVWKFYQSFN